MLIKYTFLHIELKRLSFIEMAVLMPHDYIKIEITTAEFKSFIETGTFNIELAKRGIDPEKEFRIVENKSSYLIVQREN